jgi:hypothetical protein
VMSIKKCVGKDKVEAVISMPKEMGERLSKHHGQRLREGVSLEVSRTKACRFGTNCYNRIRCSFYHDENEKPTMKTNNEGANAEYGVGNGSDDGKNLCIQKIIMSHIVRQVRRVGGRLEICQKV